MRLLRNSKDNSLWGFTLVEIVLVVGLVAIVFSMGLPVGWDFYLGYQIEVERDNLVALLREAANHSLTNRNESDHGLYFDNNNFIVFEGVSFATRNQAQDRVVPRATGVSLNGPGELVFSALSGKTGGASYTLTSGQRTRSVTVNAEGSIDW